MTHFYRINWPFRIELTSDAPHYYLDASSHIKYKLREESNKVYIILKPVCCMEISGIITRDDSTKFHFKRALRARFWNEIPVDIRQKSDKYGCSIDFCVEEFQNPICERLECDQYPEEYVLLESGHRTFYIHVKLIPLLPKYLRLWCSTTNHCLINSFEPTVIHNFLKRCLGIDCENNNNLAYSVEVCRRFTPNDENLHEIRMRNYERRSFEHYVRRKFTRMREQPVKKRRIRIDEVSMGVDIEFGESRVPRYESVTAGELEWSIYIHFNRYNSTKYLSIHFSVEPINENAQFCQSFVATVKLTTTNGNEVVKRFGRTLQENAPTFGCPMFAKWTDIAPNEEDMHKLEVQLEIVDKEHELVSKLSMDGVCLKTMDGVIEVDEKLCWAYFKEFDRRIFENKEHGMVRLLLEYVHHGTVDLTSDNMQKLIQLAIDTNCPKFIDFWTSTVVHVATRRKTQWRAPIFKEFGFNKIEEYWTGRLGPHYLGKYEDYEPNYVLGTI